MIARFQGEENKPNLIEVLKTNRLVEHNEELAQRLASKGELLEFLVTDTIIQQGGIDRDVYLIISGSVSIFVNGRLVGTRGPRETVGEMALIDATALRSATVVPSEIAVVTLKVSEPVFREIGAEFPRMYKPIAETIADRLRERSKFHRRPNERPIVFLASSVEGLNIANHIHLGFSYDKFTCVVWNQGVFTPSKTALDVLLKMAKEADFAAFVFGPDDKITSRNVESLAPRDNVIFELGLFLNELGPSRTFIVQEQDSDLKIPSDLLGVGKLEYKKFDPNYIDSSLGTVCTRIRDQVTTQGVR